MIPSTVSAWIAPVSHEAGRQSVLFRDRRYGLDLSALAPFDDNDLVWLSRPVGVEALRAEPQRLWTTDCARMAARDAETPYRAERTFTLSGTGVDGLVCWFTAEMPGGGVLSNGPGCPPTHWGQFLFPLARTAGLKAGDTLPIGFHNLPWGSYGSHHIWAARVDGRLEVHDSRRSRRAAWGPPWRIHQPPALAGSTGGA
jgi:hypothetical protein